MRKPPAQLETASLNGNALKQPSGKAVKMLKETGDISVTVKHDPETGQPVIWLWQTFTSIRLDMLQALTLSAKISEVCYAHLHSPKKPKKVKPTVC